MLPRYKGGMPREAIKSYPLRLPPSRTEFEEFGLAMAGRAVCSGCGSFYFEKSWHHPSRDKSKIYGAPFIMCPACRMIKDRVFEGELIIENVPEKSFGELEKLIRAYSARAFEEDCQHRLIDLLGYEDSIVATTTENQLANKLAKKIKDAFNRVDIKITNARAPSDFNLVKIVFAPA